MSAPVKLKDKQRRWGALQSQSIAVFTLPLAALTVLLPLFLASGNKLQAGLAIGNAMLLVAGLTASFANKTRPISIIYFAFSFAWLGVAPLYQISVQKVAWSDYGLLQNETLITEALIVNIAATVAVMLGIYSSGRRATEKVPHTTAATFRERFAWLYLAGAVALLPLAARASGGLSKMFSSRSERFTAFASSSLSESVSGGIGLALSRTLPAACAIAATYLAVSLLRQRTQAKHSSTKLGRLRILAALSFACLITYCNPLANSRFLSILAFGSIALLVFQPRKRFGGRIFATIAILATLVIYPIANVFRNGLSAPGSARSGLDAFASIDFDGFQQVANSLQFSKDYGHSWGHYILSSLFYFMPRSVWEDKARPASIDVAENRGYYFTNLSLPLHAELHLEFGLIGMAILLILLGRLIGSFDRDWTISAPSTATLLVPIVAVSMLGLIRGPLGSLTPIYLTAIALIYLSSTRSKSTSTNIFSPKARKESSVFRRPMPHERTP